ncbi:DUF4145 domain-containing protein [Vibrio albus]|uniref:DUF4145 domain-containing protein n=1 Tax=Vibrio albus TaxID=2200953 RepID=A0A2U3B585_9VIBR|nr:DUF4145 domain-containing protein [Vibrio albus]PWI31875.1 DUF4145 domain-containing protein [Vibrio albus]
MSDIEKVVKRVRRLEKLLRIRYHADGRGLHQLVSSCEERLPHDVISKLRYVATIRNKIVHEEGYSLEDRQHFFAVCDDCEKELTPRANRFVWGVAVFLMVLITGLALGFYYLHWDKLSPHLQ